MFKVQKKIGNILEFYTIAKHDVKNGEIIFLQTEQILRGGMEKHT